MNDLYHELILEEAKHPVGFGVMVDPDISIHERNASCGDEITVYLKKTDSSSQPPTLAKITWQGQGCIISQAAMSVVAQLVEGLPFETISELTIEHLQKELGLENLSPGRLKCISLGLKAVQKGIQQLHTTGILET
jgi:NifU-like protein involved in Fe-S cluster formation